ncbi:hypothetical protein CSPHI_01600 [Corynebacterium sphenisci DSM 44792]|uniref:Ketoreductase domain-containing protein n=1 Tax=Corynebacterium sphenisci DSM 44792 TaxID=1437874 RepID=A0A1L7CW22_9CORY|nr:SDR family oxidoreductase [Corynebacterium sphenisci]APT89992.1 hypothetical protein CSPHI_01600 [Corynebacterium sphenisci DSM 44792]
MSATLITGAASGIGRATALALIGRHRLLLLDRDAAAVARLADEAPIAAAIEAGACRTAVADVAEPGAVAAALDAAGELGGFTGAVHCAGVLALGGLAEADPAELARALAVNAGGVAATLAALHPHLAAAGGGSVVVIGSNAGSTPRVGMGAYSASKAAAHMLARVAALEWGAEGIRVNVVAPGATDTPMQAAFGGPDAAAAAVAGDPARYRLGIPLGRIADPGDIAAAAAFLLSDAARQITGQVLVADGGCTP